MSRLNKVAKHAGVALLAAGAMLSAAHAATQPVVQDRSINANGIELHYLAAGHGDATPVVLLHGYAESSHMWLPLIKQLDDRRVVGDKWQGKIVNNESSEIIRMLNSAFDGIGAKAGDFYPAALREEIDAINLRVYDTVNNGVYKSGFATTQQAYEEAVVPLFDSLDWLEEKLATRRFLTGDHVTEADIRLFTTLIRFDAVYVGHFKCNLRRIADYPNLSAYARDVYQLPGVAGTVDFGHIKRHCYESHPSVNPTGIVPLGPVQNFTTPHDRARLSGNAPPIA
ncbi:glutathione S-transferase C-terminal domain-containing protein [Paraburkholderia gardini]|uniref:GST C-terminal domain-containing protein n=1 Tax=Paraburkholderia gardini TaxID=2823469 RepID=A0ABM8U6J0_9BURK|nr:glutathione S-transferase C-terminal domain-containing protein [Paraburkholderia gardini]CAG4908881.1 hypothetical protein R54767_03541 [Paraburkholderia gardini]